MMFEQLVDMLNIGIVVLDSSLNVCHWNRWMALHSGISADEIVGCNIFNFFPNLNTARFQRSCRAVLAFGNFSFFSQKLHRYLFPFKPVSSYGVKFDYMQQSCTMGQLRDENNVIKYLYITVQDVTELVAYEQRLIEKNVKDSLTETYNRRFLEECLSREFEKVKRYSRPLSLIMLDIDFFKHVNDMYGHQCGDFILKSIAAKTASVIRKVDILARYGGEEFCCLLPEAALNEALEIAERIRTTIAKAPFIFHDIRVPVTVSLGVSEMRDDVHSAEVLLKLADEALYEAKRGGRNKVASLQY
jgi:diguanylate cyclase (GGDEF)-like protein/PAS domain S-box-containing protein